MDLGDLRAPETPPSSSSKQENKEKEIVPHPPAAPKSILKQGPTINTFIEAIQTKVHSPVRNLAASAKLNSVTFSQDVETFVENQLENSETLNPLNSASSLSGSGNSGRRNSLQIQIPVAGIQPQPPSQPKVQASLQKQSPTRIPTANGPGPGSSSTLKRSASNPSLSIATGIAQAHGPNLILTPREESPPSESTMKQQQRTLLPMKPPATNMAPPSVTNRPHTSIVKPAIAGQRSISSNAGTRGISNKSEPNSALSRNGHITSNGTTTASANTEPITASTTPVQSKQNNPNNQSKQASEAQISSKGGTVSLLDGDLIINVPPNTLANGKKLTKIHAALFSPQARTKFAPPLGSFERLVSHIVRINCSKMVGLLSAPLTVVLAYSKSVRLLEAVEKCRLMGRWKGKTEWTAFESHHEASKREFTFEINNAPGTTLDLSVICTPRSEKFEVTPNGCLHTSRINHSLSIRIPRGAIGISTGCTLKIVPVLPWKEEQARQLHPSELNELPPNCISEFYDFELDDPNQPQSLVGDPAEGGGLLVEFRRPVQVRIPVPTWFMESMHDPSLLCVLYRLPNKIPLSVQGGGDSDSGSSTAGDPGAWDVLDPKLVHYNRVFISFETKYLTRFCVCLSKDSRQMIRLRPAPPAIEESLLSISSKPLMLASLEKTKWSLFVAWPSSSEHYNQLLASKCGHSSSTAKLNNDSNLDNSKSDDSGYSPRSPDQNSNSVQKIEEPSDKKEATVGEFFTVERISLEKIRNPENKSELEKDKNENEFGGWGRMKKKSKKGSQFTSPTFPLRVPRGGYVQVTLAGSAAGKDVIEDGSPSIGSGTAGQGSANKDKDNQAWTLPVLEDFDDCQLTIELKPKPDVQNFVRDMLEKEQDRLNKQANGTNLGKDGLYEETTENGDMQVEDATENGSGSSDNSPKKGGQMQKSYLNAIEFKAQVILSVVHPTLPPISPFQAQPKSVSFSPTISTNSGQSSGPEKRLQNSEDSRIAVYEFIFTLNHVREYLNLALPTPPPSPPTPKKEDLSVKIEESGESNLPDDPKKKVLSAARQEFMRRIEEQAAEVMRQKNKGPETEERERSGSLTLSSSSKPLLALRRAQRTAQLAKPKAAYSALVANQYSKDSKALSGRSLQWLSRHVERGLTLGVHLNMKDSVISGIAFDSLSKRAALHDVTYRVLLQWKRTATGTGAPLASGLGLTSGFNSMPGPGMGMGMGLGAGVWSGGTLSASNFGGLMSSSLNGLNGVGIGGRSISTMGTGMNTGMAKQARTELLVQQLISALHAMELHPLATTVAYAHANDIELPDVDPTEAFNASQNPNQGSLLTSDNGVYNVMIGNGNMEEGYANGGSNGNPYEMDNRVEDPGIYQGLMPGRGRRDRRVTFEEYTPLASEL